IRELATIWDAGSCAPVQHRLVDLLTTKISTVDTTIAELTAFRGQLAAAREGLGQHTPDGPCDDACGCLTPDRPATRHPVQLLRTRPSNPLPVGPPATGGTEPIACTLGAADQHTRIREWALLLDAVTSRQSVDGGIRLTLPGDPELIAQAARLAALEQQCCRFFSFTIELSADTVVLTVQAPADPRH